MIYFVTGASGFIGKRLVQKLLARDGAIVYFLMRNSTPERLERLRKFWGLGAERAIPIEGDILKPGFGVSDGDIETLKGKVDHVFH
ncbi:MAG: SDR family oxidoreductase, partial [Rhodomicrobium sp.]